MTVNPDKALKELGLIIDSLENAHIAVNTAKMHAGILVEELDVIEPIRISPSYIQQLSDETYRALKSARLYYKELIKNATTQE